MSATVHRWPTSSVPSSAERAGTPRRHEPGIAVILSGMDGEDLRSKWDGRYADSVAVAPPLEVLVDNAHLLPQAGDALDLASGLGGSALFMARRGLRVSAWDLSDVAVGRLRGLASGLPLSVEARDVIAQPPSPSSFDVITVGHFLDRSICASIAGALRPGGLLFYQTFSLERVDDSGPRDGPFRLQTNELLQLFPRLLVRFYRDEGRVGDISRGFRNRAQLVAQRPY